MNVLKYISLSLFFILFSGCHKQTFNTYQKSDVIVAVGDSLTYGYGSPDGYPKYLSQISGYTILNAGVNGNQTSDVLNRIDDILKLKPKLVLLSIGGNDMLRKVSKNTISDNLNSIITKFKNNGIKVILIAQPEPSISALVGYLSDATIFKDVAKQQDILLIENLFSELLSTKEYKSDLIHLNSDGYRKFSEHLYAVLKNKKIFH